MAIDTSIPMMGIRGLYGQTPNLMQGFQQGRQFIGNAQLGQAIREGGDIAGTLAGFDPMAGLAYQNRIMEANKSSSGITGNMRVKMQQQEEDKPIRSEMGKIKGDIIQYMAENPDAGITDPAVASKVARMQELNSTLNEPLSARGMNDVIRDAMSQKRFEQSEREFADKQETEIFKQATKLGQDALKKMQDVGPQLAKVQELIGGKSVVTYAQAGAATKMLIQSLDNSAVMGNELQSLNPDSLSERFKSLVSRVFGGGSITPEQLNGIWKTAVDISNATRKAIGRTQSRVNKFYQNRSEYKGLESQSGDVFSDVYGVFMPPTLSESNYRVTTITGNPEEFKQGYQSGNARGGSGEIELTPRPR